MPKFGLSQPVARVEDARFLRGAGRYVEDIHEDGEARAVFVRATVAHADIVSIDIESARAAPGVLAVLTADTLDGAINDMDAATLENLDGGVSARPVRPILAIGRVRHVGETVVMVIAETLAQARDAAELVLVEYRDLPVVTDTAGALAPDAPQLHAEAPGNLCMDWGMGDKAATDAAFAGAAHTVSLDLVNNRVIANPMETRGAIATWDGERLHLACNGQGPWGTRDEVAAKLGLKTEQVRVTHPDVGGGFGMKTFNYPEYLAVAYAAKTLGRPVKWISDRSEGMASDVMGRDHVTRAEAAFDANHKLTAVRFSTVAGLGAYLSLYAVYIPTVVATKVLTG
ncbi:MAG: xanthine dehydrogenase, partial [Alphaproteobacteria bacterium HGW-Alphaproteobacteria-8]